MVWRSVYLIIYSFWNKILVYIQFINLRETTFFFLIMLIQAPVTFSQSVFFLPNILFMLQQRKWLQFLGDFYLFFNFFLNMTHYLHYLLCFHYLFPKVPCYVFDSDGKKHDLNPLIKLSDGYLVDDPDDETDFYINICRSLSEFL